MGEKDVSFIQKTAKEIALAGVEKNSLAYHAISCLMERNENQNKVVSSINFKQSQIVADILRNTYDQHSKHIFTVGYNLPVNNKKFKSLLGVACKESERYIIYIQQACKKGECNEKVINNYFININIPENLLGFSSEFYIGLIITITIFLLNVRSAKRDKQEILAAIRNKNSK